MKYQVIGQNQYRINPIDTLMKNRGIILEEVRQLIISPTPQVLCSQKLLKNIDKGIECLIKHLNNNSTIFVQVDSDVDGNTSSALIINYLHRLKPNVDIEFRVHDGKQHGIKSEWVGDYVGLVIIPDAGSNDVEEHKKLKERNIDVLVLDHHKIEKESSYAIVINNQDGQYPNKQLSGVGIVYKFCKELDLALGVKLADEFLDLVALGNIADMMDTRELETRYYILEGLKTENIKNPFIKALKEKQDYSLKGKFNIMSVAFYIAPLINATIRAGEYQEKVNMFKAFLETDETMLYSYRGKEEIRPIAVEMARICGNVKAKQGRWRDKGVEQIMARIKEKELNKNKILLVNVTGILDPNLTGLVAMQLVSHFQKPVILLQKMKDKEGCFGGSARGYDKCSITDFQQFCLDTKCFEMCQGHPNAFGVEIKVENLIPLIDKVNLLLKDETFESIYYVDFKIPCNDLDKSLIRDIVKLGDLWGQGFEEPYVAITNIELPTNTIEIIGKEKTVLKFKVRDIEFVKFKSSEEEHQALTQGASVKIDLVGRVGLNEYEGKVTPQVIIEDYNYQKSQQFLF